MSNSDRKSFKWLRNICFHTAVDESSFSEVTVPLSFESFDQDLDCRDTQILLPSDRDQENISYIELSDDQSEELENVTEQACALVDDFEKELDAM